MSDVCQTAKVSVLHRAVSVEDAVNAGLCAVRLRTNRVNVRLNRAPSAAYYRLFRVDDLFVRPDNVRHSGVV